MHDAPPMENGHFVICIFRLDCGQYQQYKRCTKILSLMLTFDGQHIGNIFLTEINQSLDCYQYEVKKDGRIISTIYCSSLLSLMILPHVTLRVDRERRLLRKNHHKMFNQRTGTLEGTFDFPDWQSASHTRCIVWFTDNSVYSFNQNNDHRKLLKPKTWNVLRFEMTNSENTICYIGTQSFGEIECTNEKNLLPIVSGIFIIDEKFRIMNESN